KLEEKIDFRDFSVTLEDPTKNLFQHFIGLFWESVRQNGQIRATSIVDPPPGGFWENRQHYLEMQRILIETRGVNIYRYFLFAVDTADQQKDRLKRHADVLKDNIDKGILTRVTIYKLQQQATTSAYKDIGLVDDLMAVENDLANGNISHTRCYIKGATNTLKIQTRTREFKDLEDHQNTVKSENYRNNFPGFIKAIEDKIDQLYAP
ncbi:MAG: hypothetical protein HYS58_01625, partial [Elusimicrobia bacterium]|nr:hypothetical protein [Elusimicrobiota bacterium]